MMCKRRYCDETVLPWLDPDYCGTGCRETDTKLRAALNAREITSPAEGEDKTFTHRVIHPPMIPMAEAARRLGYELADLHLAEPAKPARRRQLRWPWSRR